MSGLNGRQSGGGDMSICHRISEDLSHEECKIKGILHIIQICIERRGFPASSQLIYLIRTSGWLNGV